jgi:iron complex transport system permease protein
VIKASDRIIFPAALVALSAALVLELCCGSYFISPLNIFDQDNAALLELRLLRAFTAFIVGGALAVSGLAYQAVLRNPLAEPYILGISGGAGIGAAIAIISGLNSLTVFAVPGSAFICALLALSMVLLFARGAGLEYTNNIMLSGIIVGTVCSSMLMFIISTIGMDSLNSITWWLLGNLQGADYWLLRITGITVIIGTGVLFIFGREANAISLGEEMAYNLGVSPQKVIVLLLAIASLMAASAVALSGIIGFVGLIVPHVLRRLFGAEHRRLFPLGLLGGGIFLMLCDVFSKVIYPEQEIQVGVVTALIGGPFFLWALNRKRRGTG